MKIGILTHPQGTNYGGILQCYALCTYLRKLGHEPMVIQRVADKSFWRTRQTLWSAVQMLTQKLCCQTIHDCPKVVPLHYESE